MNLLPWIGGAGTLIGILALFVKIAARWFARKIDSLKESVNLKVDGAVETIRAETAAKVDGSVETIRAETAAKVDGAVETIRAETAARIDGLEKTVQAIVSGAVREIKTYVDGVIKAFKAEARGERKIQEKEMESQKCATEENKRDIRNLESVVYRGERLDEDLDGENPDAPKPG